jgi:hypothetical protein
VTGAFILIDFMTNNTVGAGMLQGAFEENKSSLSSSISKKDREERLGQTGQIIWLLQNDLQEQSKMAYQLETEIFQKGLFPMVIDSQDSRYAPIHTATQAQIIAKRMADAGLVVIVSAPQSDYLYALESCAPCKVSVITDNEEWTLPEGFTQFSSVEEALTSLS